MRTTSLDRAMIAAALAGGAAALPFFRTPVDVRRKGDASPVTEADLAAEAAILPLLRAQSPGRAIVSEEMAETGAPADPGRRFFLVDPLDGTREFIAGRDEFTVNVALVENGAPIAGVVYAPACGVIYAGRVGRGAWMGRVVDGAAASWTPIHVRPRPVGGLVALASRSHADAETDALLAAMPIAERIDAGSSLKFGVLARGEADVYPRFSRTMQWDTAAGHAVLLAAGGLVLDAHGRPLGYGPSAAQGADRYANPAFVACSADAAETVRAALRGRAAGTGLAF